MMKIGIKPGSPPGKFKRRFIRLKRISRNIFEIFNINFRLLRIYIRYLKANKRKALPSNLVSRKNPLQQIKIKKNITQTNQNDSWCLEVDL